MTAPSEREPREAQLDGRLRRFARLRKAERALAPSVIELQQEPSKLRTEDFRRLLETVAELARTRSSDATFDSAMCDVDAALDEYAESLRRHADAASMAQLRATLPAIASQHREETLGLLDLWTEDEAGLPERVARVEYLVTLLSTREDDGVRRVVADPATLTPDFATLCTRIEQGFTGDLGDLELALHQAASELEQAPNPGEVARSLRERKEALGVHRLMPGVLRAIVSANLQLTNRMQARLREERDLDERFDGRFLATSSETSTEADTEVGFAADPATGVAPAAPDSPVPRDAAGSILESEGLFVLREALRRRLRGASIGSCSSEMLALRLDLSSLDEEERLACTRDTEDPSGDDTLIALAVLLGTLLPGLAEYRDALAELRIPEEALAEAWPRELNALLQARNSEHLLANRYEASCRLSETRTKFLFAPVTARVATASAADVELQHAADGAAATATRGAPGVAARTGAQRDPGPFRRPAVRPDAKPAAPRRRLALALAASLALTLGAFSFHHLTLTSGESVRDLSQRELSTLSGQLVAAYRSDAGTGSLLVGRVGIAWRGLDAEEQREEARMLSMRLARAGVAHVMIYDTDNRLVVDFAGGQLRVPAG